MSKLNSDPSLPSLTEDIVRVSESNSGTGPEGEQKVVCTQVPKKSSLGKVSFLPVGRYSQYPTLKAQLETETFDTAEEAAHAYDASPIQYRASKAQSIFGLELPLSDSFSVLSSSFSGISYEKKLETPTFANTSFFFHSMLDTVNTLIRTKDLIVWTKKLGNDSHSVLLDEVIDVGDGLKSKSEQVCIDCLVYLCTLFPKDYEIEKDTLVQLWMAEGLIKQEPMEDIGSAYLIALQATDCLSLSRDKRETGKLWYKVNNLMLSNELSSRFSHLLLGGNVPIRPPTSNPLRMSFTRFPFNLEILRPFPKTRTLFFLQDYHCSAITIDRLPYDFFTSFRLLAVLSLSDIRISEIPNSIGNLKDLCYLDLSKTLIKQLPETIDRLQQLQTLKLRSCPRLTTLPKRMVRLTTLRHLDLGLTCYLHSMPPGMGALTSLRTLSIFLVGSGFGCSIAELKKLNNLMGYLSLSRLQNVASLDDVKETKLSDKKSLRNLELKWSPRQRANIRLDDEVVEYLRPHTSIQDLRILHYGGSVFPRWISDPSFNNLLGVNLINCENCTHLPSLGQLPHLESLEVTGLIEVKTIGFCFYMDIVNRDTEDTWFPNLQSLAFKSMLNLEEWVDVGKCHFPILSKLVLKDCPKMTNLCQLSDMDLLQNLEITTCPLLASLPEGSLPSSVEKLVIEDSPLLKSSCSKPYGRDWDKVAHVISVWVDYENISTEAIIDVEDQNQ